MACLEVCKEVSHSIVSFVFLLSPIVANKEQLQRKIGNEKHPINPSFVFVLLGQIQFLHLLMIFSPILVMHTSSLHLTQESFVFLPLFFVFFTDNVLTVCSRIQPIKVSSF